MDSSDIIKGRKYTNYKNHGIVYLGAENSETGRKYLVVIKSYDANRIGNIALEGGHFWRRLTMLNEKPRATKRVIKLKDIREMIYQGMPDKDIINYYKLFGFKEEAIKKKIEKADEMFDWG